MRTSKIRQIIRQFRENGMKLLLENPQNVRDLLAMAEADVLELVDTNRLKPVQTTFVQRDYRHIESDVVLVAPLRRKQALKTNKSLLIYILIEHQSDPDRLMPLRLLDYVVQIFKFQVRQWAKTHRSFARIRLQPVLPVVFYTGKRRWDSVGRLVDLIEMGTQFEAGTPLMQPLFLNLPAVSSGTLESQGGFFGWVLRLVQQREARPEKFRQLLNRAIQHLKTMPSAERLCWLELLSYIVALVYHERSPHEIPTLQGTVEASVTEDVFRKELGDMRKTYADVLKEEGATLALRRTLIRQLTQRFGNLPDAITDAIESTEDPKRLNAWLDQFVTARTLEEMEFPTPE